MGFFALELVKMAAITVTQVAATVVGLAGGAAIGIRVYNLIAPSTGPRIVDIRERREEAA
jgi:hypothetical protein